MFEFVFSFLFLNLSLSLSLALSLSLPLSNIKTKQHLLLFSPDQNEYSRGGTYAIAMGTTNAE